MKIEKIITSDIGTDTYFIIEGDECIVVDPGGYEDKIDEYLDKNGLKVRYVLLTHGHYDHCMACAHLTAKGAEAFLSSEDIEMLKWGGDLAHHVGKKLPPFTATGISDGDVLRLLGAEIKVLATPGHTGGSVCYLLDDVIFSGDTLFRLSVGRTDLPTGDRNALDASLKKLFALEGDYLVLPGHGAATNLSFERENNPYARF